ncbi:beta-class carbonic anhydrase [Ferdinandcohnia sp. Marseille-Q9671]
MSLDSILKYNQQFVETKEYEKYQTTKLPNKKMVIVTCMDTRLVELLPKAMNIGNGDVKLIKVAGGIVSHPFGSVMRSILVAVYELGADEVCIIGHHDCGMSNIDAEGILHKIKDRGVTQGKIDTLKYSGIQIEKWFEGFSGVEDSVKHSVEMVQNHPLLPRDVPVHGLVINPETGKLDVVVKGNK